MKLFLENELYNKYIIKRIINKNNKKIELEEKKNKLVLKSEEEILLKILDAYIRKYNEER